MERRTFVSLSVLGIASMGRSSFTGIISQAEMAVAEPLFLKRLCDVQTILKLGVAYRGLFPLEDHREVLINGIIKQNSNYMISLASNKSLIHSILEKEIVNDFKEGRWIELKGWILSLIESRQCALYSLLHS